MVSLGRWHPAGDTCTVEVFGTKGTVSCQFLDPVRGDAVFHRALQRQAEEFAAAVRADGTDVARSTGGSSAEDALAALSVAAEAAAKQAR
jgi:hypothetical protein